MKKALITGITGQDGSYLAQLLIKKGMIYYEFVFSFSNIFQNIDKIIFNPFIILGLICMVLSMITHII